MLVREPQTPLMRVGVDLVEIERVGRLADRFPDRLQDIFTEAELTYALRGGRRTNERLAARFAAKEAAFKALGTGMSRGAAWTEIGIERELTGRPRLELSGHAARIVRRLGLTGADVSLSHTREYAFAQVMLFGAAQPELPEDHDGPAEPLELGAGRTAGPALRPAPLGYGPAAASGRGGGAARAERAHHQLTHHRREH